MEIAEFFVNIGIKGADKTVGALGEVKGGLSGVLSSSLAAKAALLAVVYGAEKLTSAAATTGAALHSFSNLTGMSTEGIQKWENAFRQVNVPIENVRSSFVNMQKDAAKWLDLGDAGMAEVRARMMEVNGVEFDPEKMANDPNYRINQLIKYLRGEKNIGKRNVIGNMAGADDQFIAGVVDKRFSYAKDSGINGILKQSEVEKLNGVKIAWDNIWDKVDKTIARLTSAHGEDFMKGLSTAVNDVERLVKALDRLGDRVGVFRIISELFHPLAVIADALIKVLEHLGGTKDVNKDGSIVDRLLNWRDQLDKKSFDWIKKNDNGEIWHPPMSIPNNNQSNVSGDKTVNVTINGSPDPAKTIDQFQQHINIAGRQLFSQEQLV